jgi:putative redox protein
MDKLKELVTSVTLVNDKLHFSGTVEGNVPVSIDYTPPLGDNLGYTSLELFLFSLTSCIGSAVLTFLRRMNRNIKTCEIHGRGIRKEVHPTGFSRVKVEIIIGSEDITEADMQKVITLAEDKYCPVLSMVKGNVEVGIVFAINN